MRETIQGMHTRKIRGRLRTLRRVYSSFTQEGAKDMDELIRTLAVFGRPFPPDSERFISSWRKTIASAPAALASFYQQKYPAISAQRGADIQTAGKTLLAIYQRNVFPDL